MIGSLVAEVIEESYRHEKRLFASTLEAVAFLEEHGQPLFLEGTAFEGLDFKHFCHLSVKDRRALLQMIARISEKSYRRGLMHACPEEDYDFYYPYYCSSLSTARAIDKDYPSETCDPKVFLYRKNPELCLVGFARFQLREEEAHGE